MMDRPPFQMKTNFLPADALDEHKLKCAFARAEALAQVKIGKGLFGTRVVSSNDGVAPSS